MDYSILPKKELHSSLWVSTVDLQVYEQDLGHFVKRGSRKAFLPQRADALVQVVAPLACKASSIV